MDEELKVVPVMFQRELKESKEEQRDPAAHDVILYTYGKGSQVYMRDDPEIIASVAGMVGALGFPHVTMAYKDVPYELGPIFRGLLPCYN